ncbi:MAG: nucleotidyl transferase AbiEii/AbiGii toxin family protein [Acidobacteria bacterium]|nr:nucleotidyl transferase AbiEii/AbiGii toxin family protein [Acidobacteriota bacterium]
MVLIEETLHSLFTSFTDTFVLFGGATLVLFYGSQRHSADIDLLHNCEEPPQAHQIINAISPTLNEVAQALGLAPLTIATIVASDHLLKINVESKIQQRTLFTIDVSRTSALIKSELVTQTLLTNDAIVKYPTRNLLLLQKAEAFLGRKNVKCRDAFDIKLLKDSGAELDENLKFHLEDGAVSDQLGDPNFINQRIVEVTPNRCAAELQEYLPEEVYRQLAEAGFEPLRQALRDLFGEWLEQ